MKEIKGTVRELKEKASSEWIKAKEEGKIKALAAERDFFKNEAFKLDRICKDFQLKFRNMKKLYEDVLEDRNFLEAQLKKAKKINKVLYLQQFNQQNYKTKSDISVATLLRKDQIDFSDKSSSDKLMVSEEKDYQPNKPMYLSRKDIRSFALEKEHTKSAPLQLKKK